MATSSNSHQSQPAGDTKGEFTDPKFFPMHIRQALIKNRVKSLPASIHNRVVALKNDQLKRTSIDTEYWKDMQRLEEKYQQKCQKLMDERKKIVTGEIDPPKQDPKWPQQKEEKQNLKGLEPFQPILEKFKQLPMNFKGLPNFWAIVLRNCAVFNMMDQDVPALKKLLDITIKTDSDGSFTFEFLFDENEYFTDTVLTKKYFVKLNLDENSLMNIDSPVIFKSEGCKINWKENKNLTQQTIKKNENTNECEQVPCSSFFNFFDPPIAPKDTSTIDWVQKIHFLNADYEQGKMLRYTIIPKAVLFYSGDVLLDEMEECESDDDEEWIFEEDNYAKMDGSPNGGQTPKNEMPTE